MDERFYDFNNKNNTENNPDLTAAHSTVSDDTQEIILDAEAMSMQDFEDNDSAAEKASAADTLYQDDRINSERSYDSMNGTAFRSPYNYSDTVQTQPSRESFNPYAQTKRSFVPSQPQAQQQLQPSLPAAEKPKKKKNRRPLFAVLAICASLIISGGSFYGGVRYVEDNNKAAAQTVQTTNITSTPVIANTNTVTTSSDSGEVSSTITEVVENAMPSMVAINTIIEQTMDDYGYFNYFFGGGYGGQTYESSASGSGIIIGQNEEELLIVTNYHVIEDAKEIAIEFIDGESYSAEVKGTASENDLAVVSVKLSDISAATLGKIKVAVLGDSTTLKLGEPAIAIGNSLGYGQSVTVGYISATERTVQISDKTMTLIQTDAAINPGNSGGALLNIKGEVIGINSAKLSDTSVEGTGYAIPISDAAPIINDLMSSTHVSDEEKPYLGIYGSSVPETYQTKFGWPAGAYVSRVLSDSPAELAGLQSGDIITAIDDKKVDSMDDLETILSDHKVGDKINITIARTDSKGNVKSGTVTATLIAKSESDSMTVG